MAKRKKSEMDLEEFKRLNDEQIVDLTDEDEQTEVIRGLRDVRPAHYLFKIYNFSSLAKIYNYESNEFEVSGYKWKLSVYPKGVDENNMHLSLYLVLSKSNAFTFHQEVNVYFKLFVYNQIRDKYLTVQDAAGRISRFRGMKTEHGFDQFLPLSVFNDKSNGYLIDDCCVFGAEIFVVDPMNKGECATVVYDLSNNTYTWNVPNFSELKQEESYNSEVFVIGGYKWSLCLYPNGNAKQKGKSLSLFLTLEDDLEPGHTLSVEYFLRIKDQIKGKHHDDDNQFSLFSASSGSWGCSDFIPLSKLNDASEGFLVNDAIILEVQISFISNVEEFS